MHKFEKGATVRQYHDSSRIRFDDAVITFVHGNGALDVQIDGKGYGWSENFCEVISPAPEASTVQLRPAFTKPISKADAIETGNWMARLMNLAKSHPRR